MNSVDSVIRIAWKLSNEFFFIFAKPPIDDDPYDKKIIFNTDIFVRRIIFDAVWIDSSKSSSG